MSDTPDAELLGQFARSQSEAAFAELVRRHIGLVYSTAFRKTENPQQAEDITQAVFIILARKAGSLGPKTVLPGWLYHTARLTASNLQRADLRRIRREQEAFMQSTTNEPAPDVLWRELAPLLEDAMAGLGASDRDAIVLRFFQNRSMAEVGAALGASESAAKMRVGRALEKLRKFFTSHGVQSTSATIAGTISANSIQTAPAALAKSVTATALAKGAAASTSTLTLVKGALKVMAWSKAKTIIAGAAVALLGVGGTTIAVDALLPVPDVQGTWEGMVDQDAPGIGVHRGESPKVLLVLRITKVNGAYQVNVDNYGSGWQGQPDSFTYQYPYVHAELKSENFTATGKMSRFGNKMIWACLQNTNVYPIVFRQTPQPPPFPEPLAYDDFAPGPGSPAVRGFWTGMIGRAKAQAGPLTLPIPFEVKIGGESNGTFRADFLCRDESASRQPAVVTYDGTTVTLTLWDGCGMFEGKLRDDGKEMTGDWIQDGYHTRTTLTWEDYSNAWETPNLSSALVGLAYPQVRIVRTKFPRTKQIWEHGDSGGVNKWGGINIPVSHIVRVAYIWWPARIVFTVPEPKGNYDFIASLPQGSAEGLQHELTKQFGLVGRVETMETNVLILRVRTPNAPGLKPPNVGGGEDWPRAGEFTCDDLPLSSDARPLGLQRSLEFNLHMPVMDETGLTNHYSIDLKWNSHESLKQALLDQLGLELVPGRRSVRMLVVERGELASSTEK